MSPAAVNTDWGSLPREIRNEIEAHVGDVTATSPAGEGMSTTVRLVLHTPSEDLFIKGTGPGSANHLRDRLALGADLAPYVTAVSPPLLWRVQADGWDITGWPALPGRPWANQKPGSPDIAKMTGLLTELSEIPAPGILTTTARGYWERYSDDPGLFDGDAIVHRDPNPTNFVIDGPRAWMVDFGWAVRGPAWMTAANLAVAMMEAGWEPADADNALKAIPAWVNAPLHAVDELAFATVREWDHVMGQGPVHEVWQFRAAVARTWADYRAALMGI